MELNTNKITITSYLISMTSVIFYTMFYRSIFGSSSGVFGETSEIFGELREISENVWNVCMTFGQHLENLLKSSKNGQNSSENRQKLRY